MAAGRPIGRDEAAAAGGVDRSTAAHHLDKLTDAGLLEVEYRRLTGRQGPGAGRPAKLYRQAAAELQVSLPPRDYELVAELLASLVESVAPGGDVVDEVARSLVTGSAPPRPGTLLATKPAGSPRLRAVPGSG